MVARPLSVSTWKATMCNDKQITSCHCNASLLQKNGSQDVTSNVFKDNAAVLRAPLIALLQVRGPVCWDVDFYLEQNPDLAPGGIGTAELAWQHYITSGQFEGRPAR